MSQSQTIGDYVLAHAYMRRDGIRDRVVPPNQAEMMFDAVRQKGLPVAYIAYEGEQHGFRKAANIKRTLEAEFCFFARIFRFAPADRIEPVKIENLG